jgi:hypothetical protein
MRAAISTQQPTLVLANRSDFNLAQQVTAPGATWLDHRLVERESMPLLKRSSMLSIRVRFLQRRVSGRG